MPKALSLCVRYSGAPTLTGLSMTSKDVHFLQSFNSLWSKPRACFETLALELVTSSMVHPFPPLTLPTPPCLLGCVTQVAALLAPWPGPAPASFPTPGSLAYSLSCFPVIILRCGCVACDPKESVGHCGSFFVVANARGNNLSFTFGRNIMPPF